MLCDILPMDPIRWCDFQGFRESHHESVERATVVRVRI